MYEVDGRTVHMDCRGTGSPVVILDAGLGVLAVTTWAGVHDELAERTTVCAYDRAGMGLSESGPKPRTAGVMADELRALLQVAELEPPYVLVGASFGAFVDELYAFRHPDDVAGLVLVDGVHPDLDAKIEPILGPAGTEARKQALAQTSEGVTFDDILASDEEARHARPLPPVPLIVLQHGISFDLGGEPLPALERLWTRLQRENARLSPEGRLVVAKNSHHRIAEDEPDVVVAAVNEVLDAVG
jgi:pimeloyl-ACP methyl ester carboxylesterase